MESESEADRKLSHPLQDIRQLAGDGLGRYHPTTRVARFMSTYRRNVLVGVTVLASLLMLGWMIVRFGANIAKPFAGETIKVRFKADRVDGISDGSPIYYRGVSVGRVAGVLRDPDQVTIWIDAQIDVDPPLPARVHGNIRQMSLLGTGAAIVLEVDPGANGDKSKLQAGAELPAYFIGLNFFPPEVTQLSSELTAAVSEFRRANVIGNLSERIEQVGKTLDSAQKTLDNLNAIVGDEAMQRNIHTSIENIRQASENAKNLTAAADRIARNLDTAVTKVNSTVEKTDAHLDDIAQLTKTRLEETAAVIKQTNEIAAKINDAKGTAGQLVNDPKLYEGLVETTAKLNATISDLQRLIQQWEQEGVSLKLR